MTAKRTMGVVVVVFVSACSSDSGGPDTTPAITAPAISTPAISADEALSDRIAGAEPAPGPACADDPVVGASPSATARPQDNFYRYVNGAWLAAHDGAAETAGHDMFTCLDALSSARLRRIADRAAAAGAPAGSDRQLVGDFYASYMDAGMIEARGLSPVADDLARIAEARTAKDVARAVARANRLGGDAPFALRVAADAGDGGRVAVHLHPSGLGIPDAGYYSSAGPAFARVRQKYRDHVRTMLDLGGVPEPDRMAAAILALEARLAAAHQAGDGQAPAQRWTRTDLREAAPGFEWSAFLRTLDLGDRTEIVVARPEAVRQIGLVFADTPVEVWRAYLAFHWLSDFAPFLPRAFVEADFAFNGRVIAGRTRPPNRWRRALDFIDVGLGDAMGRLYVEQYFAPHDRALVETVVDTMKAAFIQRIDGLDWMSDRTRRQARDKLAGLNVEIGYPDHWRDYAGLRIDRDDALGNARRIAEAAWRRDLQRIGRAVGRADWLVTPQTVNAYYDQATGTMVFPAALLQPPFFDPRADGAVNYGAIGALIGHELIHGFDLRGRATDGGGAARDWWTADDARAFRAAAAGLIDQYNGYSPVDGMAVNGVFTLAENIADLGGLVLAHHAYRMSLSGRPAPVIDGLSGDERFFLSWGRVWRRLHRDGELERRLVSDPHSPPEYRINGTVRNMDAWYEAFDVRPGDALYLAPEDRVRLW